jgi:hypothetical protein
MDLEAPAARSMRRAREIADRKALLSTRAEFDRARMTLAILEVKAIVAPVPDPSRSARLRPTSAMIVGFVAPLLGASRLGRWLRILSYGLAAMRIARGWRSGR